MGGQLCSWLVSQGTEKATLLDSKKENSSSSSSSFTADLFGTKEAPPTSSTGIFASIFPPPSMVYALEIMVGTQNKELQVSDISPVLYRYIVKNLKELFNNTAMTSEAANHNMHNKDRNSIFMEERAEPYHLNSISLYYGGQDNYSQHPNGHNISGSYP
ncbi:uncharacterized protein LOC119370891 [Jatropha curcas]|uniref:uncharacterized protein LOC119370891 n=1 Tax=Jatropha curcas TaxID=180498 RepID=UPI001892F83B|nr:uncharacterized protein LOC119370891 [Jatropha curcas]